MQRAIVLCLMSLYLGREKLYRYAKLVMKINGNGRRQVTMSLVGVF